MTTLAVYHKSVPNKKNQEKVDILRFFAQGARAMNDTVIDVDQYDLPPCDVAVIQGWVAPGQPTTPHGDLRSRVIKRQLKNGKHVIGVDSNLFLYADTTNPGRQQDHNRDHNKTVVERKIDESANHCVFPAEKVVWYLLVDRYDVVEHHRIRHRIAVAAVDQHHRKRVVGRAKIGQRHERG